MMKMDSPMTYGAFCGLKNVATSVAHGFWISWPTVGGKAMIDAAKMTGMTPAMLTRSGREVSPPEGMRRPMTRFEDWIRVRRWPSWMNTTAAITASATKGIMTLKTWSEFVHQA